MNRRGLFSFLAATPFIAAAVRDVAKASPVQKPEQFPLGFIMDLAHPAPISAVCVPYSYMTYGTPCHVHTITDPGHSHGYCYGGAMTAVVVRSIWDGEKFVTLASADGAAVMNSVMAELRKR